MILLRSRDVERRGLAVQGVDSQEWERVRSELGIVPHPDFAFPRDQGEPSDSTRARLDPDLRAEVERREAGI